VRNLFILERRTQVIYLQLTLASGRPVYVATSNVRTVTAPYEDGQLTTVNEFAEDAVSVVESAEDIVDALSQLSEPGVYQVGGAK
jgi:hypothetical protein